MITWARRLGVPASRPDDIEYIGTTELGVEYVVVSGWDKLYRRRYRAYRVVADGRRHPAGRGGELLTRKAAYEQAEMDLAHILADRLRGAAPAVRTAAKLATEMGLAPVPEDVTRRIVRRAKYDALRAMLDVVDGWVEGALENNAAMDRRDRCSADEVEFRRADIRRMINDAAREVGTDEPYREAVKLP